MTQLAENNMPYVKDNKGFSTKYPLILSGSAATLAVGGASTFTGVATFTAAPVFNGGRTSSVISGQGATVTLTAAQSGSACINDRAAGIVWTLPAPTPGLEYSFYNAVTVTSNSYKVITDAGTTLLAGFIASGLDNTANKQWVGNGTSHIAVTQAAASTNATGGILGGWVRFFCTTTTQWVVSGLVVAGGTTTTPFTTS